MGSSSPEFQQELRWTLGFRLTQFLGLALSSLLTLYCWRIVWKARKSLDEEYEGRRSRINEEKNKSIGMTSAKNSYRSSGREEVYSIPMGPLPANNPRDGRYDRQTSLDTTYNVPSIQTEVSVPVQARFDSIPEIEEDSYGKQNEGFLL